MTDNNYKELRDKLSDLVNLAENARIRLDDRDEGYGRCDISVRKKAIIVAKLFALSERSRKLAYEIANDIA